ncbi:MAG TPA: site-specific DNA-methyltransferase [Acetobacteraceae bacterium]|nr:site-specific DNA-methyltransferase [Acetobacteraceae bacterium]
MMADAKFPPYRTMPIAALVPYANNARTHSDAQVAQIAASIREFGFTNPVLVDGQNGVIAGHGRLLAARKLGMTEVPVIELAHLSPAQRRAYVLADNRLALSAGWDEDLLRIELGALRDEGFDLGLTGFEADEIAGFLAETSGGLTDPDEIPPPPAAPVARAGDVWRLGRHRLVCGDATALEPYTALLGGSLADMAFTDPPYNVDYRGSVLDRKAGRDRAILNDALGSGFEAFLYAACTQILSVTKGAVYVCMSSSELHSLQRAFTAAGGHWSTFLIWAKNAFSLGRSDYQRQYEPILYGWPKGVDHFWCGARDQGDVWFCDRPKVNDLHPTMKPVALVERAVRNSSKTQDIVLDPFGGSGTTLIACEQAGRQARLIELDPRYCDVILQRWQAFAGEQAVLEGTGESFAAVAAQRVSGSAEKEPAHGNAL